MKLSTRMRYGTRALVEIGAAPEGTTLSLKEVAVNQRVSLKYLEHIIGLLKAAGLVNSIRGPGGGYELARPALEINLRAVYNALEGPLSIVHCVENGEACPAKEGCPTRETWAQVQRAVEEVLEGTTLADLIERRRRRRGSKALTYHI